MIAGAVTVRLTKVAGHNWSVDGGDNLGQSDAAGVFGQNVATTDAPLRANEAYALQAEQNLFEVGLGESSALGEVTDRNRVVEVVTEREAQQRSAGVVTSGRHLHAQSLPVASEFAS